ncbi:MAG TPA: threonine synthase [Anaerolineae bacterium]|nr:threonine synthase [Anaerolineae bacterium]
MDQVAGLRCTLCGATYEPRDIDYVCPRHGYDGVVDVLYDYRRIARRASPARLAASRDSSMWRYLPLLPVDGPQATALVTGTLLGTVGWTPLLPAPRLAARLGLRSLWVKDDGRQPTASLKDRASAVAVAKARELRRSTVTTASTGNAAAALAGLCAAVGQPNVIFVPHSAPPAKIAQLLAYGAQVLLVDGTYDDAFELCLRAAPEFGWYSRSTGYNPYMSEGKKTVSYEICEQLAGKPGAWAAPDVVVVPVGDGCIIGGVYKGFVDLLALGWIDRMPRLVGVQAEGSSPLVEAWERGLEGWQMVPVPAHSLADSIVSALPRDRIKALRAVRDSGGAFLRVSDEEILAAIPALAQGCGVFAEPAAAAAFAGLVRAVERGLVRSADRTVLLATGSGLKDVASAARAVGGATLVEPTLEAVRSALNSSSQGRAEPGGRPRPVEEPREDKP